MTLLWKEFHIDLSAFNEFLKANVPEADGIVASPDNFIVVEKDVFSPDTILLIQEYYNNLQPEVEDGASV